MFLHLFRRSFINSLCPVSPKPELSIFYKKSITNLRPRFPKVIIQYNLLFFKHFTRNQIFLFGRFLLFPSSHLKTDSKAYFSSCPFPTHPVYKLENPQLKDAVIVSDIDDNNNETIRTLTGLGISGISSMKKGVLWQFDAEKDEIKKASEELLYNKHYQEITTL